MTNEIIIQAENELAQIKKTNLTFKEQVQSLKIINDEIYIKAGDVLKDLKKAKNDIDEDRKKLTKPLDETKKAIMEKYKPSLNEIEELINLLTNNMKEFAIKKAEEERKKKAEELEKARIEAERLRQEAEAKAQEELLEAQIFGDNTEAIEQEKEQVLQSIEKEVEKKALEATVINTTARSAKSTTSAIPVWKFEVINPELVPIEYTIPCDKKIKEAVKNGARDIPGVRIYEDIQIKSR